MYVCVTEVRSNILPVILYSYSIQLYGYNVGTVDASAAVVCTYVSSLERWPLFRVSFKERFHPGSTVYNLCIMYRPFNNTNKGLIVIGKQ